MKDFNYGYKAKKLPPYREAKDLVTPWDGHKSARNLIRILGEHHAIWNDFLWAVGTFGCVILVVIFLASRT